ncbi:MAG: hypothetical protein MK119_04320 [Kordia sp.]|nr:hypothetical protein [Kordia sp.]
MYPEFLKKYLAYQMDEINASNIPAEQKVKDIAYAKEMMKNYVTPAFGTLLMFSMVFILGIVMSILTMLTLQRKSS